MSYLTRDLSTEQRLAIESLIGRKLAETETVAIRAFEPPPVPSAAERRAAIAGLRDYFDAIDASAAPAAQAESDEIFEEAMRSSRPGFRTHR